MNALVMFAVPPVSMGDLATGISLASLAVIGVWIIYSAIKGDNV